MIDSTYIPDPPEFSEEQTKACHESRDFRPMLFEWNKFIALLCNYFSLIHPKSPMLRSIPKIHYSVCVGLLNRCSRLMLSNLSQEGRHDESTSIIDRCIFESCVILTWLCLKNDKESFERFLADGLKTELAFKSDIEKNIKKRKGQINVIEDRMLTSINNKIISSTLTESQIRGTKKLPDIAAMLEKIGHSRLMYTVGQKIASHFVHGTWPDLTFHYLEITPEGFWSPHNHINSTHQNQYIFVSLVVLDAMKSFIEFCIADQKDRLSINELIDSVIINIQNIKKETDENNFDVIPTI